MAAAIAPPISDFPQVMVNNVERIGKIKVSGQEAARSEGTRSGQRFVLNERLWVVCALIAA
jgi:hypothetical protein